jgi:hypothetical protein
MSFVCMYSIHVHVCVYIKCDNHEGDSLLECDLITQVFRATNSESKTGITPSFPYTPSWCNVQLGTRTNFLKSLML